MLFLLKLPFRLLGVSLAAVGLGFRLGRSTVRVAGYRRLLVLGVGVGIGVLVAPAAGAEMRERLKALLDGSAVAPGDAAVAPPTVDGAEAAANGARPTPVPA